MPRNGCHLSSRRRVASLSSRLASLKGRTLPNCSDFLSDTFLAQPLHGPLAATNRVAWMLRRPTFRSGRRPTLSRRATSARSICQEFSRTTRAFAAANMAVQSIISFGFRGRVRAAVDAVGSLRIAVRNCECKGMIESDFHSGHCGIVRRSGPSFCETREP
jgi:hypothetical protein